MRPIARAIVRAMLIAVLLSTLVAPAAAHPDNDRTLDFTLTCDDGNVWNASFNGGPAAFHLDGGQLYIWKQIWFVTPTGESGTLTRGSQGFAAEPVVECTYIGAVSGNAYTVIGFYPPAD